MKINPRVLRISAAFCLVVLTLTGLILFRSRKDSDKQTLPDGTVILLSELKIGRTNVYTHGTWFSKTLGRLAPSNGITVAKYKLERPTHVTFSAPSDGESLSAQFQLLPGSPREAQFLNPRFERYRLLVSGEDGFDFVNSFGIAKDIPKEFFSTSIPGLFREARLCCISVWRNASALTPLIGVKPPHSL